MPPNVTISQPQVKINGSELSNDLYKALIECSVENDLYQPDVASLFFHISYFEGNPTDSLDNYASGVFRKGAKLEISMEQNGETGGSDNTVFVGEVTSLGPDYGRWTADDPVLFRIRGLDKTHRLTRVRESNTYLKQSYSDIVKKIASSRGLSADVDSTSIKYEHVIQANQTPWEFLQYMAAKVGYDVYVKEDKLYFKKHVKISGSGIKLERGQSLAQFSADASVAFQVKNVNVRGWDPKTQKAIVGKATAGTNKFEAGLGEPKSGVDIAKATLSSPDETHIGHWPVVDQNEAKILAEALAYDMEREHVHAEGVTIEGMPNIMPLELVDIQGVGKRFDGKYLVTSTTHRYDGQEGYTTTFTVGGPKPNSLSAYLGGQDNHKPEYPGVVIAIVTNIKDPDGVNRVKLKYPWLGDDMESDWARIAVPDAGPESGFQWLPEINDEVLVAFEHGDINRPFVLGSLWSEKNKPPVGASDLVKSDKVAQRMIKSRSGHTIILNDENGKEQIIIRDKTEKNEIVIDSKENTMTIKVDKDITLEAGGKIDIKAAQAIAIESSGQDVKIDCQNFEVNAKQGAKITANTTMDLKSTAPMTVESSATMAVKGAIVNIG